jgi:hypothetical protein
VFPARLCCFLGEVLVPCHKDVISSVLSRIQGHHKVTTEKMSQSKGQMETDMPSFSPAFSSFVGPSKESMLFSRSSLKTSYIIKPLTLKISNFLHRII